MIKSILNKLATKSEVVKNLKFDIETQDQTHFNLSRKLDLARGDIQDFQREVAGLKFHIGQLQLALEDKQRIVISGNSVLNELEKNLKNSNSKVEDLNSLLTMRDIEIADLLNKKQQLEDNLEVSIKEVIKLNTNLNLKNAQIESLHDDLDEVYEISDTKLVKGTDTITINPNTIGSLFSKELVKKPSAKKTAKKTVTKPKATKTVKSTAKV